MTTIDPNAELSSAEEQFGMFSAGAELGAVVTQEPLPVLTVSSVANHPATPEPPGLTARMEGVLKNKGGDWAKISVYGEDPKKVLDGFMLMATQAQLDYDFALNANELSVAAAGAQPVPFNPPPPQPVPNLSPNMQPAPTYAGAVAPPPPTMPPAGSGGGTNLISNITISVTNEGKTFVQVAAQGLQYPLKDSRAPNLVLPAFDPSLLIEHGGFWSAERLATPGAYSQNQMTNQNGIIIQQSWGGYPLYVDWVKVKNESTGKTYYNISKIHR